MITNLTYMDNIFESLGVFNTYNFTKNIDSIFEKYASKKLKTIISEIQHLGLSIDNSSMNDLTNVYSEIERFRSIFEISKQNIVNDNTISDNFKETAIEFFNTLEWLSNLLHTEIHKHPYNKETEKAMKEPAQKLKKYSSVNNLLNDLRD